MQRFVLAAITLAAAASAAALASTPRLHTSVGRCVARIEFEGDADDIIFIHANPRYLFKGTTYGWFVSASRKGSGAELILNDSDLEIVHGFQVLWYRNGAKGEFEVPDKLIRKSCAAKD